MCALCPAPCSRSTGSPSPPQSSRCSRTPPPTSTHVEVGSVAVTEPRVIVREPLKESARRASIHHETLLKIPVHEQMASIRTGEARAGRSICCDVGCCGREAECARWWDRGRAGDEDSASSPVVESQIESRPSICNTRAERTPFNDTSPTQSQEGSAEYHRGF